MTLNEIQPGNGARVLKNRTQGRLKQRLMNMGFHPGVEIRVIRNAPLVDPVEFLLEGQNICLRHEEAGGIEVETL